jgi:TolB-like protein
MPKLKKAFFAALFTLLCTSVFAQTRFEAKVKKMTDSLSRKILATGKKRITVANFVDLQNNVTELGKYLAEVFSVELSNTSLEVVDRSRLQELVTELKMSEEKLTRSDNALKLGEMAGLEYIIIGTTTVLDTTVDITVKALDIQRGISIGGQRESIPRTDAINQLFRSQVAGRSGTPSSMALTSTATGNMSENAQDVSSRIIETDMRKKDCQRTDSYNNVELGYGQICFENLLPFDLILYQYVDIEERLNWQTSPLYVPQNTKTCSPNILVKRNGSIWHWNDSVKEYRFYFKTVNTIPEKKGELVLMVDQCKVKTIALVKTRLLMN